MSEASLSVLVLAGGISHERDISLRSGRKVADALTTAGHRVTLRDPDAHLLALLHTERPDVVFPALHGASGEDGSLLALLEAHDIPTVGSSSNAARQAWNKPIASTMARAAGLAVPDSIVLSHDAFRELGAPAVLDVVRNAIPGRLVVKPAQGGSAQGVCLVDPADLARGMVTAFNYADVAVVERCIAGTEVAVVVVDAPEGPTALIPTEIQPNSGVYGFEARYNAGETTFFTPARLPANQLAAVQDAAVRAHQALGLRDFSRIDFIVDDAGIPWFLEAAVFPGMTETSVLPLAFAAASSSESDMYSRFVAAARARHTPTSPTASQSEK